MSRRSNNNHFDRYEEDDYEEEEDGDEDCTIRDAQLNKRAKLKVTEVDYDSDGDGGDDGGGGAASKHKGQDCEEEEEESEEEKRKRKEALARVSKLFSPIDNERRISDQLFAMSVIDKEAEYNTNWELPARYMKHIEYEYGANHKNVTKDPLHVCNRRGKCVLKPLEVTIYRRKKRNVMHEYEYHCCLRDICEHAKAKHVCACQPRESCPHFYKILRENTYKIQSLFVCEETGTLHACGENCTETSQNIPCRGMRVCPITNLVLGAVLVREREDWETRVNGGMDVSRHGGGGGGGGGDDDGNGGGEGEFSGTRLLTDGEGDRDGECAEYNTYTSGLHQRQQQEEDQEQEEQIEESELKKCDDNDYGDNSNNDNNNNDNNNNGCDRDREIYYTPVHAIMRELLYSTSRQKLELKTIMNDHDIAITRTKNLIKKQRKRMNQVIKLRQDVSNADAKEAHRIQHSQERFIPVTLDIRGAGTLWPCIVWANSYPASTYFRNFPVLPEMRAEVDQALAVMSRKEGFVSAFGSALLQRRHAALQKVSNGYLRRVQPLYDPKFVDIEGFFNDKCEKVACAIQHVWLNMKKHHKSVQNRKSMPLFAHCIVTLMYMMKEGLQMRCPKSDRLISVIPIVPLMNFLPIETTIKDYIFISQYVRQAKTIRQTQSEITYIFSQIAESVADITKLEVKF